MKSVSILQWKSRTFLLLYLLEQRKAWITLMSSFCDIISILPLCDWGVESGLVQWPAVLTTSGLYQSSQVRLRDVESRKPHDRGLTLIHLKIRKDNCKKELRKKKEITLVNFMAILWRIYHKCNKWAFHFSNSPKHCIVWVSSQSGSSSYPEIWVWRGPVSSRWLESDHWTVLGTLHPTHCSYLLLLPEPEELKQI